MSEPTKTDVVLGAINFCIVLAFLVYLIWFGATVIRALDGVM